MSRECGAITERAWTILDLDEAGLDPLAIADVARVDVGEVETTLNDFGPSYAAAHTGELWFALPSGVNWSAGW